MGGVVELLHELKKHVVMLSSVFLFSLVVFALVTGDGELITATLYPYWNDEPNADMSVVKARTVVNLCRRKSGEASEKRQGNVNVTVTPGVQLTPLLSAGFPHSSVLAMAAFGLTLCSNDSSLCYYCSAGFFLPFGQEIREQRAGLLLGFSFCLILLTSGAFVGNTRY